MLMAMPEATTKPAVLATALLLESPEGCWSDSDSDIDLAGCGDCGGSDWEFLGFSENTVRINGEKSLVLF